LTFAVSGAGRRATVSRFTVRCDAIGLDDDRILLLSVAGPETSVKALAAGLRASGPDQQRIDYAAQVGAVRRAGLTRYSGGYRVHRTRLAYGLWHLLCLARCEGFLPVLSEETVWRLLSAGPFTTPLLRGWVPWLVREMRRRGLLAELTQSGCQAGLLLADNDMLDALVSEGVRGGALVINGRTAGRSAREDSSAGQEVRGLDDYLRAYGALLGRQAERSLAPLHVPGRDAVPDLGLLRQPFEAQAHVIEACRKALRRQQAVLLVGEMGTGNTLMALAAAHAHAAGRPYRALVFCPGQLVPKWGREVRETIPGAAVIPIRSWKDLLRRGRDARPAGPEWYVITRDRAKLGARWKPAYQRRTYLDDGFLRCPQCGRRLVDERCEPLDLGRPAAAGRAGTGL
jgi:hypothetical protein